MTIPGTIAEQPTLPTRAPIDRVRGADPQKEAGARSNETEDGFSDVLSKLKGDGAQSPDETQPANESQRLSDLRRMGRRDLAVHVARGNGEDDAALQAAGNGALTDEAGLDIDKQADLPPGTDPLVDAPPDAPQTDIPADARAADTKSANAIAALLNVPPASAGTGNTVPVAEPQKQTQGADPAATRRALLTGSVRPGEAQVATQPARGFEARAARGQPDQSRAAASELEVALASETAAEPASALPGVRVAAEKSEKVSVVGQETHFAPVAPEPAAAHARAAHGEVANATAGKEAKSSEPAAAVVTTLPSADAPVSTSLTPTPAQQIADQIGDEVSAFEAAQNNSATAQQSGAKPVLKILQIQLQPADLGTVTVRMELKDAELMLHVEADRPETAEMIRSDQDTLSKLLRSAGYGVDAGSIRVVEGGDRSVTPTQASQQGPQANLQSSTQSHQSQQGFSERQERPHRDGTAAQGSEAQTMSNRNEKHETTTARTGRDLYV